MNGPRRVGLLIIGGGPAAYTAALYTARSGLRPVCVEGYESGGQISRSALIENFPGAPDGMSGADLANRMRDQAVHFGAEVLLDEVQSVDLSRRPFRIGTGDGSFLADAVIVASGSRPRALGLPNEDALVGRGVAYCALCDGAFFAGLDVIVVGGGNAALGEALAMARIASRGTGVHRRHAFRADSLVERRARETPGIEIVTPSVVEELVEDDQGDLCGVRLHDLDTGEASYRPAAGLFVAIGHIPSIRLFEPYLAVEESHLVTAARSTATSVPGVFAAGDVADPRYRQAVTAAASGCMAAIDAERWLASGEWHGLEPAHRVADSAVASATWTPQ